MTGKVLKEEEIVKDNCKYKKQEVENRELSARPIDVLVINIFDKDQVLGALLSECPWDISKFHSVEIVVSVVSDMIYTEDGFKAENADKYNDKMKKQAKLHETYMLDLNAIIDNKPIARLSVVGDGNKYNTLIKFKYNEKANSSIIKLDFKHCSFQNGIDFSIDNDIEISIEECVIYNSIYIALSKSKKSSLKMQKNELKDAKKLNILHIGNLDIIGLTCIKSKDASIPDTQYSLSFTHIKKGNILELRIDDYDKTPLVVNNCDDISFISLSGTRAFSKFTSNFAFIESCKKVSIVNSAVVNIVAVKCDEIIFSGARIVKDMHYEAKCMLNAIECKTITCTDCHTQDNSILTIFDIINAMETVTITDCTFNSIKSVVNIESCGKAVTLSNINCIKVKNPISIKSAGEIAIQSCAFTDCEKHASLFSNGDIALSEIKIAEDKFKEKAFYISCKKECRLVNNELINCGIKILSDIVVSNKNKFDFSKIQCTCSNECVESENKYNFGTLKDGYILESEKINITKCEFTGAIAKIAQGISGDILENVFKHGLSLHFCESEKADLIIKKNTFGEEGGDTQPLICDGCKNIDIYDNTFFYKTGDSIKLKDCVACKIYDNIFKIDGDKATILDENGTKNFFIINTSLQEDKCVKVQSEHNMLSEMIATFAHTKKEEFGVKIDKIDAKDYKNHTKSIIFTADKKVDWVPGFISSVTNFIRKLSI